MSKRRIKEIIRLCKNRSIQEEQSKAIGTVSITESADISTRPNNIDTAIQLNINLQEETASITEKGETSTRPNNIDTAIEQNIDLQENIDCYTVDTSLMSVSMSEKGNEFDLLKYLENDSETPSETSNTNDNATLSEASYANLENADPISIGYCENGVHENMNETFSSEVLQETVESLPVNSCKILQEKVDYEQVELFNNQQPSDQFEFVIQTVEVSDVVDEPLSVEDNASLLQNSNSNQVNENDELTENNQELVGAEEVEDQDPADAYAEPDDIVLLRGRPKKGRKRKIPDQSRADRQKKCRTNQDYINIKGKLVESREFRDYQCSCKCNEKVSPEDRLKEFTRFWSLDTLSAKCLFVCSKVTVKPVARKRVIGPTIRSNTRVYSLAGQPVCKAIFLQTLRISSCRVNKYLQTQKNLEPIKDNRGQSGGSNKLPQSKEDEVVKHISKYPKYKSHYCRERNEGKQYLTSETTLPLMYSMYKEEYPNNPVSLSKYKQIFYSKFNLTRKTLKKDTCNKCDTFSAQAQSTTLEGVKEQIRQKHEEHLSVANDAQALMKDDLKRASEDSELEVLTFDMQKTLPLPRIPTNIVFYKRQLWLYNLGIHSGKQNKGYCYTWLEGEAGRGAQEVGSCIIKHLKVHLIESVKELIVWSDSCGGQNRNIKMVLLFKTIFKSNPHLETIRMRYLVPGHTFLPNDSEFGDIECALKKHNRLYTPDDYINVIENARKKNKFVVTRMSKEDFFSTHKLEIATTNRKKFIDGSKVNWLKTREIVLTKDSEFSLGLSTAFNDVPKSLDIKKRELKRPRRSVTSPASNVDEQHVLSQRLDQLWPNGKPITVAKLADLTSLLHLIPGDAKQFYINLTVDRNAADDIDGFGGDVDFDVEQDEEDY